MIVRIVQADVEIPWSTIMDCVEEAARGGIAVTAKDAKRLRIYSEKIESLLHPQTPVENGGEA